MTKTPLLVAALALATAVPLTALAAGSDDDTATTATQPQAKTSNSSIKSSIKAQFVGEKNNGFDLSHIDVDVHHRGVVSLEGTVPSQEAADRAVSLARATAGVHDVKNELKIKNQPM